MNTQMRSTSNDIDQYITPDVILKYFNETKSHISSSDKRSKSKEFTLKRAFKSLQNMEKTIKGNPFYKDTISYPIYIEHANTNNNFDYDFLLLTNDLIQKEMLDEIHYDDTTTLMFLFLKDQLYPTEKLSEIGLRGQDGNIRADIAKFIEFSKNNKTDPISAFLKLIKIAGRHKAKNNNTYNGLLSFAKQNKALNNSISSSFFKLFGGNRQTGEIKDIHFLLNEINHLDMDKFFNDGNSQGNSTHYNNNRNSHRSSNSLSELERQLLAVKVTDYNKILSMVDSLIVFNRSTDILTDIQSSVADTTIKINTDQGEVDIDIDYEKLMKSVRDNYFEAFIIVFVKRINDLLARLGRKYNITSDKIVPSNNTPVDQVEYLQLEVQDASKSLQEASAELQEAIRSGIRADIDAAQINVDLKETIYNNFNQTLFKAQNVAVFHHGKDMEKENALIKEKKHKSNLVYNVQSIQNELVGILKNLEAGLYKDDVLKNIFDTISNNRVFTKTESRELIEHSDSFNMKFNIDQLSIEVFQSLHDTLSQAIFDKPTWRYKNAENEQDFIDIFSSTETIIRKEIDDAIHNELYILLKRLGNEYGNNKLIQAQKYAKLRTEKNPIIKKTISNISNFKTFIISREILLSLYETLNYVDNQKYIAGLISTPPSRANHEKNQMKYVLIRLGLIENPVYILGEGKVIINSPDYLSMTGSPLYSEISFAEMHSICNVNYHKDLYSKDQMFKKDIHKLSKDLNSEYIDIFKTAQTKINAAKSGIINHPNKSSIEHQQHMNNLRIHKEQLKNDIAEYKLKSEGLTEKGSTQKEYNDISTSTTEQEFDRQVNHKMIHQNFENLTKEQNKNKNKKNNRNNNNRNNNRNRNNNNRNNIN